MVGVKAKEKEKEKARGKDLGINPLGIGLAIKKVGGILEISGIQTTGHGIKMMEITKALGEDVEKAKGTILAKEKAAEKVVIKITTRTIARIIMVGEVIGSKIKIKPKTPKERGPVQPPLVV